MSAARKLSFQAITRSGESLARASRSTANALETTGRPAACAGWSLHALTPTTRDPLPTANAASVIDGASVTMRLRGSREDHAPAQVVGEGDLRARRERRRGEQHACGEGPDHCPAWRAATSRRTR